MKEHLKAIRIRPFPIRHILKNFHSPIENYAGNNRRVFKKNLPAEEGKGKIIGVALDRDISFVFLEGELSRTITLELEFNHQNSLQFVYNLGHPFLYQFSNDSEWVIFEQFQHAITMTSSRLISKISLKSGILYNFYLINIPKKQFLENRTYNVTSLEDSLQLIFKEIPSQQKLHLGHYNLKIADIFKEINDLSTLNFLDYLKLELNIHELIFLHLQQYNKDFNYRLKLIHPTDVKQVKKAAEYIHKNIEKVSRIDWISREVGLNRNKLQQGFQELYGQSVNGYIRSAKMNKARVLLGENHLSLSQISHEIGIASPSYFSRLFKEFYQITPSEYRKQREKKIIEKTTLA
ncbi:helix-turn-helix transcriptional regulator [Zunongwangia sp. HGR-M22]|uniref:helix-turn-helix transcriptional regulator n=1 Tax=Zunongwangia sp. HGR-M22 TaxID=3015168 RepID=UPI0022DD3405|nr:helix-turn-helix transcriptional regulator [Zunongwangia sp. HGR-M22]WBL24231.1 helix-turn-helix transcriptional regulator [Zunongwangia sp. HGR-M22]